MQIFPLNAYTEVHVSETTTFCLAYADQEWGQGVRTSSLKNHKNIGIPSNTGPATKPAFNVGPSSARQRNAISTFQWRFAGGPMLARFWSYLDPLSPHQLKNVVNVGPTLTKLSGSAHVWFEASSTSKLCLCRQRRHW